MKLTLGYLKDTTAFIFFAMFFILKYLNIMTKLHVLIFFTIGFIIDGIFTFIPKLHNMKIVEIFIEK